MVLHIEVVAGVAWQSWMVESIAETMPPQPTTHHHLWLRVFAVDGRHVIMSFYWGEFVCHIGNRLYLIFHQFLSRNNYRGTFLIFVVRVQTVFGQYPCQIDIRIDVNFFVEHKTEIVTLWVRI